MSDTKIWITFQRQGFHCYPSAPDEVAYLRERHRHIFHFKVTVSVEHDDREIEFHMLSNALQKKYDAGALELNYKSCEMLARDLIEELRKDYGLERFYAVEVSEDGECGAEVVWRGLDAASN